MKTELLVSISKKGLLGTNEEAFKHLIMASGRIKLAKKYLEFENKKYVYSLETYNTNNVDVINYHFSFWTDEDKMEIESEATSLYSKLQDYIECVLRQHSHHIEILWDDLSYECAQKAYPLIYTVENKMRFLITKFMLVNVGTKWEKENMPLQIKNSNSVKRNEKNSDKFGIGFDKFAQDIHELSDKLVLTICSHYFLHSRYFPCFLSCLYVIPAHSFLWCCCTCTADNRYSVRRQK